MEIINSRQIIRQLLLDTDSRKIRWTSVFESSNIITYVHIKNITNNKKLKYELVSNRDRFLSRINIHFGPIKNKYQLIGKFYIKDAPLLYDLLDSVNRKYNDGDISYIPENMSFYSTSNKPRNIRLINKLYNATKNDELKWKISSSTQSMNVFNAVDKITENKEIVFNFKTSYLKADDNILKILFKVSDKKRSKYSTLVINSLDAKENRSLKILIKLLYKKYLGIDFDIDFNKSVAVEVNDFENYKQEILKILRDMKDTYPRDSVIFNQISLIYNAAENTKDYNVLNDLLYKAKLLDEQYLDSK